MHKSPTVVSLPCITLCGNKVLRLPGESCLARSKILEAENESDFNGRYILGHNYFDFDLRKKNA